MNIESKLNNILNATKQIRKKVNNDCDIIDMQVNELLEQQKNKPKVES